ncbi:MAG TPA: glycoside hydrolase family 3 N-terminal domain-containing protein [Devosia sp.]|nr:glycoside hydrolase family 3 N-terminal domain-containing protein [Devosia sp.]
MTLDSFRKPPFNLDDAAIAWVRERLATLPLEDKARQLFNLRIANGYDEASVAAIERFRPGGVTRAPGGDLAAEHRMLARLNAAAPLPLLVSADLEGSRMSLPGGTELPNPLGLAALDDIEVTRHVARIMAEEARAVGINWTFTPLLDVNAAWRSPIVATRGFGSDVATVERHAVATLEEFQKLGVAAAVKHWPGEGYDDRDQHLVTTTNPLSMDAWELVFGRLYRAAIAAGVMSVMSAHIALPAFVREVAGDVGLEAFRPASMSRLLNEELLRGRLGFDGLIVSDATSMSGLTGWANRRTQVIDMVAGGCDVILFSEDPAGDLAIVLDALASGAITAERLDEAVARILAMKAALGLHRPADAVPFALATPDNRAIAEAATKRMPTLVKDVQHTLPLDPQKHRRVLVITPGIINPWVPHPIPFAVPDLLREHGFEVRIHQPGEPIEARDTDLILYLFGEETLMTRGRNFIDWLKLMGDPISAMHRYWHDIPTVMISFGYPYLLYDAPRVPTCINAYMTTETMQRAVVDLLLGNGQWNRHSPVDPFCGMEDARY